MSSKSKTAFGKNKPVVVAKVSKQKLKKQKGSKDQNQPMKMLSKKKYQKFSSKKKGFSKPTKDPEVRANELDKELEGYWVKGGHADLGK